MLIGSEGFEHIVKNPRQTPRSRLYATVHCVETVPAGCMYIEIHQTLKNKQNFLLTYLISPVLIVYDVNTNDSGNYARVALFIEQYIQRTLGFV